MLYVIMAETKTNARVLAKNVGNEVNRALVSETRRVLDNKGKRVN